MTVETFTALVGAHALEILAVLFGIAGVYLSTRESIWSWPAGLVNVSLYFVIFFETKLYADMGLQAIYFALSLYGWYEWRYGGEHHTELAVSRASRALLGRLLLIGIVGAAVLGTLLARLTDAAFPYLDSAATSTSLIAQWLMTRKLLESWAVWIAVDLVYVGMFVAKSLYLTAGLYALFLVLAVLGHVQWTRSLAARQARAASPAPAQPSEAPVG